MRFFHLSDLHLGIKLYEHDLLKDQKAILDEIVALTRQYQPDAVVFAGDIYDRSVPPVEAVALFDDFMTQLRAALPNGEIMLISGNHDSAQRLDVFRSELSDRGIHMIGNPPMQKGETIERVTLTDDFGAVNFYLLPFVRPGMVRLVTGTKENGDNLSYPEAFSRLLGAVAAEPRRAERAGQPSVLPARWRRRGEHRARGERGEAGRQSGCNSRVADCGF